MACSKGFHCTTKKYTVCGLAVSESLSGRFEAVQFAFAYAQHHGLYLWRGLQWWLFGNRSLSNMKLVLTEMHKFKPFSASYRLLKGSSLIMDLGIRSSFWTAWERSLFPSKKPHVILEAPVQSTMWIWPSLFTCCMCCFNLKKTNDDNKIVRNGVSSQTMPT